MNKKRKAYYNYDLFTKSQLLMIVEILNQNMYN